MGKIIGYRIIQKTHRDPVTREVRHFMVMRNDRIIRSTRWLWTAKRTVKRGRELDQIQGGL